MGEPISTPKLPAPIFKNVSAAPEKDLIPSSSPGFGTPAYPIQPRRTVPTKPFSIQANQPGTQAVLPILLPPQTLRPVAFRTLTKKHNLTLTSSGLASLAQFVGKFCGSRWREDGLAERVLDEIAKHWKRDGGSAILDDGVDKKLRNILKTLESCMSGGRLDAGQLSRHNSIASSLTRSSPHEGRPATEREDSQQSLGVSNLEIEDNLEDEGTLSKQDTRSYMKVISAFDQPRLSYSVTKKTLEPTHAKPSLLPSIQHKISMFKNRYHLVHQRLLRNESFQTPSFTTTIGVPKLIGSASNAISLQQAYKITSVSNLLGRSGTSHLLLGLLVHTAAGDLALTDLTSSVVLDISIARPVPEDGAWFCPGMIVLVEGTYEEDGSNSTILGTASGVGGQIKGRFLAETVAGPPAERREITLDTRHDSRADRVQISGAGFGWIDFLGVGSERALGARMRRIRERLLAQREQDVEDAATRTKVLVIGECHLDNPRTLEAIRAILNIYTSSGASFDRPLSIVFMGNFASAASMAGSAQGGGSIEYKERFDNLAGLLAEFPSLLATTTFVFVPGNNDPWASSFSSGAATLLPQQSIPELFTSRVRRAVNNANTEAGQKGSELAGETIWTSNPARVSLFGPVDEIVLFRDDITSRLRRNAVMFPKLSSEGDEEVPDTESIDPEEQPGELDRMVQEAASQMPKAAKRVGLTASTVSARKLVKTILDQGHLSPFPISTRPALWDYASALNLYPLPTALVLADTEVPAFTLTYEGCHVMNPGRILDDLGTRKGMAKFVEYDVASHRGVVRDIRF